METLDSDRSLSSNLWTQTRAFTRRFIQRAAMLVTAVALVFALLSFWLPQGATVLLGCGVGAAVCATAYLLSRRERLGAAATVLLAGVFVAASISLLAEVNLGTVPTMANVILVLIAMGAFLFERRELLVLGGLGLLGVLGTAAIQYTTVDAPALTTVTALVLASCMVAVEVVCLYLFVGHSQANLLALHDYAEDIERVVDQAARVAAGDLSGEVEGASRVSGVVRAMLEGLRTMVKEIRATAASLGAATAEIAAMARQQELGAVEQASAVHEVQQTLDALAKASATLAESAAEVHRTSEQTRDTNRVIGDRIAVLSAHTRRIGELLEVIKGVADKSEVLALNASLEGAKAGDVGRGFSLVATQMQRLAENVMGSVGDVKSLTRDIQESMNATVTSTEEGMQIAVAANDAAREISRITARQKASTEQVSRAIEDISTVATQVSTGSTQTLAAARDLSQLSEQLGVLVSTFRLPATA